LGLAEPMVERFVRQWIGYVDRIGVFVLTS
jgi:hypothetical protein